MFSCPSMVQWIIEVSSRSILIKCTFKILFIDAKYIRQFNDFTRQPSNIIFIGSESGNVQSLSCSFIGRKLLRVDVSWSLQTFPCLSLWQRKLTWLRNSLSVHLETSSYKVNVYFHEFASVGHRHTHTWITAIKKTFKLSNAHSHHNISWCILVSQSTTA